MKRKMLLTAIGTLCLSAALFAGGSQPAGGAAGTGSPQKLTDISWMVWDRGMLPANQGTLEDNWWTRYVNEKIAPLGARLTYVVVPRSNETQLLSTMLAANNAPDISKTADMTLIKTYISGGGIADLTPSIEKFGANIKSLMGDGVLNDTKVEGKLYYVVTIQNGIAARTTFIRKDWLDAIGMAVPETPEEFYQVLKAIKEKDPGKQGAALIPFGMIGQNFSIWDTIVLPGFIKTPPAAERFLEPYPMWPEAKDTFRYLNRLYNEGLLTDQFILDKDESLFRQKIARGEMFAFLASGHYPYHSAYGSIYDKLREVQPEAVISNIDTFRNTKTAERMEFWTSNPAYQNRHFVPFSSAAKVDLAVKVMDWMSTEEGYMVAGLGIEGVDYNWVNGVPATIDHQSYLDRVPWVEPQYGLMARPFPGEAEKNLFLENYIKDFNPDYHDQIRREANFYTDIKFYPPTLALPTPVADKTNPVLANYWSNEVAKIVTAPAGSFDRVFDGIIAAYREMGGDDMVREAREIYSRQQAR